ncbi:hypothetical protein KEM55_004916 [Ascosphaera atra]|nr:hypothetical protein KEM55_004916 [Ascosphaera atra]
MGVPFEALIPYGIIITMFGVTGVSLGTLKYYTNGKKNPRRALDRWDKQMMERDQRLTGVFRGQANQVEAPEGYEIGHPWKVEKRFR